MNNEQAGPYLITRELVPENQESPIQHMNPAYFPEELFYRRNHFAYPLISESSYQVIIHGQVLQPRLLDDKLIRSLPARTISVVLECAGNKRSFFEPKTYGEQWDKGAIGQGIWKGVPLSYLLQTTGLKPSASEIIVEGWDAGQRKDLPGVYPYARSLPLSKALHPETLLAYEYNGKPLSLQHGFPFRLIVPDWYAMSSVKWVRNIIVSDEPFQGPFQTIDYQYYPNKDTDHGKTPVTIMNVNSSIQRPLDQAILSKGKHRIVGIAWTGLGEIRRVKVSVDRGHTWGNAQLRRTTYQPNGWTQWEYEWEEHRTGEYSILSQAEDTHGRIQPMKAYWNRKGYGYNAVDEVNVKVE